MKARILAGFALGVAGFGISATTAAPAFAGEGYEFRVVLDVSPDAADDWQVTIDQDLPEMTRVAGTAMAVEATLDDDADPTLANSVAAHPSNSEPIRIEATALVPGTGTPTVNCADGVVGALDATPGHVAFELSDWAGERRVIECTIQVARGTQTTTTTTTAATTTTTVEPTTTTTESVATTTLYVDDSPPARTRSSMAPPPAAPAAPTPSTPAFTGSQSALLGGIGALLVLLGAAIVSTGRRRSQR